MKRILKWVVPVDGQRHPMGTGYVVHVDCQNSLPDVVHVWTEEDAEDVVTTQDAQVCMTGESYDNSGTAVGTVMWPAGGGQHLVLHLVRFRPSGYKGGYIKN